MADPLFAPLSPYDIQQSQLAEATKGKPGFDAMAIAGAAKLGRSLGYKSAEEQRAEEIQRILGEAQLEVVTTDDPARARLELLTGAARRFNARGMTDVVQQIIPELMSVHRQIKEMRKIDQDANTSYANEVETRLDTDIKRETRNAVVAEARAKAQAAGQGWQTWYNAELNKAAPVNTKNPAMTDYYASRGYFPYEQGLLGTEGLAGLPKNKAADVLVKGREQATAAANYMDQLAKVAGTLNKDPQTATLAGPVIKGLSNMATQAKYLMGQSGIAAEDLVKTREGANAMDLVSKGLRRKGLENAVLDLAYARARVRDPGGRLSNQDVEMAMRIFNAYNPLELAVTINQQAGMVTGEISNYWSANALDPTDPGYQTFQDALDRFETAIAPPATGTQTPSGIPYTIED